MDVSIIIRTYNEQRHLGEVLEAISNQDSNGLRYETIVIDSGSTDNTLQIANAHSCRIIRIGRDEFTFGRSLNRGCEAAYGQTLVFISGHCIPADRLWLTNLVSPIRSNESVYVYGRQIGNGQSRYSERQLFKKYYTETSAVPQDGYFCNNANAAIKQEVWKQFRFDEELTGLEDMELAKRLTLAGNKVGYVAEAAVYHIHEESWTAVRSRYEREALALRSVMPEVHLSFFDVMRYFTTAVVMDSGAALKEKEFLNRLPEILLFRLMQFWGAYRGNHQHRELSRRVKEKYFYPK